MLAPSVETPTSVKISLVDAGAQKLAVIKTYREITGVIFIGDKNDIMKCFKSFIFEGEKNCNFFLLINELSL